MIPTLSATIEILASFIETLVMYDLLQLMLSGDRSLRKSRSAWVIMLCCLALSQGLNAILPYSSLVLLAIAAYGSVTAKLMHKAEFTMALGITCLYLLAAEAFDFFFFSSFVAFWGGVSSIALYRSIAVISSKAIWCIAYSLVRGSLAKTRFDIAIRSLFAKMSLAGLVACLVLVKLAFDSFPDTVNQMWFIVSCALICSLFYNSYSINSRIHGEQDEMIAVRDSLLEDNYVGLKDIYSKNAELYHDLDNHLNTLYQLLASSDIEGAKEYIERISDPIRDLNKTVWTGVDVVDAILNSKLEKAGRLGIGVSCNVEFPANTDMQAHDICTILSNLMDNAIEACMKCDGEKRMDVSMRRINRFLVIRVSNDLAEPVMTLGGNIVTTKADSTRHGWGIRSVQAAVDKYDGSIRFSYDEKQFTAQAILFF